GLTRCCSRVLELDWGEHPLLGRGSVNIGRLSGGVADNVVADRARAELLVRSVRDPQLDEAALRGTLGERLQLEVSTAYPPVEFHVPEGEEGEVVGFGTDAPYLGAWGRPLLVGPGEIALAHTSEERIAIEELVLGVALYERLIHRLLA
ncbi:MAG: peptidase dimerization domain-containing protein, partial [Planctomycetota bacterium]